jgi:hypothetical protein
MPKGTLKEFAEQNKALIDVAVSADALFVCALIARNGYTQTAEFPRELEVSGRHIRAALRRSVKAGFIAHRKRPGGIFNGWVATAAGRDFLATLGLVERSPKKHVIIGGIGEEISNSLAAQRRHGYDGPTVEQVTALVECVPEDRQEWLGFAICFEPIPGGELTTLLAPSPGEFGKLREHSLNEIEQIPAERWQNWASKHGVERTVDPRSWTQLQQ